MNNSTRRFFSLLISLALIIGAGVIYIGFIQPTYDDIGVLRGELAQREAMLAARNEITKQMQKLLEQYGDKDKAMLQMSTALPEQPDAAMVVTQIQGVARQSGVIIGDIGLSQQGGGFSNGNSTQDKKSNVLPIGILNFSISISGPYDGITKFIASLEQSVRIMDIRSVALIPEKETGGTAMRADLLVAAYYQKSPEANPKN